jgi:hypothetical protein
VLDSAAISDHSSQPGPAPSPALCTAAPLAQHWQSNHAPVSLSLMYEATAHAGRSVQLASIHICAHCDGIFRAAAALCRCLQAIAISFTTAQCNAHPPSQPHVNQTITAGFCAIHLLADPDRHYSATALRLRLRCTCSKQFWLLRLFLGSVDSITCHALCPNAALPCYADSIPVSTRAPAPDGPAQSCARWAPATTVRAASNAAPARRAMRWTRA